MRKKLLALFLALLMCLSLLPVAAFADEIIAGGDCTYLDDYESTVKWSLDSSGKLTISGEGIMRDFGHGWYPWWVDYQNFVKSVVIEDGVVNISDSAFWNLPNLESVTIGSGVEVIEAYAFDNCTGLKSITIPYGVESIGVGAFYGCSSLQSVSIPNTVVSIGSDAFRGCVKLTGVTIPGSVKNIGEAAFRGCSLTALTIPAGVESIGTEAFCACRSLKSISVDSSNPNYSAENGVLFSKDKSELICFPAGKTGKYTIPASVTSIGDWAFYLCEGLTEVTIPNSVTSIGAEAFGACVFTSLTIPDSIKNIGGNAFVACDELARVNVSNLAVWCSISFDGSGANPVGANQTWGNADLYVNGKKITDLVIPGNVTAIGDYAFCSYKSLTSAVIPGTVKSIGGNAFCGCDNLRSVTIGDGVESIGDLAFYGCNDLVSVTIPGSVKSIGDRAFDCGGNFMRAMFAGDPPAACHAQAFNIYDDDFMIVATEASKAAWIASPEYDVNTKEWNGYPIRFCANHQYSAVVTEPTCHDWGFTTYTCEECGDSFEADPVSWLPHNYVNGVCTRCGETDPDQSPLMAIINSIINAIRDFFNRIFSIFSFAPLSA